MPASLKTYDHLVGRRFDRLVVLGFDSRRGPQKTRLYWLCLCDCGTLTAVQQGNLTSKQVRSCGCLGTEARTTHGLSTIPEFKLYHAIKQRCYNKNYKGYERYGGRGVRICRRWMRFENFIADMGRRPSRKHSVERLNNNKGYSPDNCVWTLPHQQTRNTRRNIWITAFGRTQCMQDWTIESGLGQATIKYRIDVRGMSPEEAMSLDGRKFKSRIKLFI